MTSEPTAEERISEWLHDEATGQLPDWVLTATFERTRADRQRRELRRWGFPSMNTPMKVILLTAISLAALLGISFAAGQRPNPSQVVLPSAKPSACSPSQSKSDPAAGGSPLAGGSPVEFLWSAVGPADDPMKFDTADQMDGAPEAAPSRSTGNVGSGSPTRRSATTGSPSSLPTAGSWSTGGRHGTGDGQFNLRNSDDGIRSRRLRAGRVLLRPRRRQLSDPALRRGPYASWARGVAERSDPGQATSIPPRSPSMATGSSTCSTAGAMWSRPTTGREGPRLVRAERV